MIVAGFLGFLQAGARCSMTKDVRKYSGLYWQTAVCASQSFAHNSKIDGTTITDLIISHRSKPANEDFQTAKHSCPAKILQYCITRNAGLVFLPRQ